MRLTSSLLLFLAVLAQPLSAQIQHRYADVLGQKWNNPGSALIATHLFYDAFNKSLLKKGSTSHPPDSGAAVARPRPQGSSAPLDGAFSFHPVAETLTADTTAEALASTPEERRQLAATFRKILTRFASQSEAQGHPRDIAHAAAFFLAITWGVNRQTDVPNSSIEALGRTLQDRLRGIPSFRNMGDRERQELWESLVLYCMVCFMGFQDARTTQDESSMQACRQMAGSFFQTLAGVSPDEVSFGPGGLVRP